MAQDCSLLTLDQKDWEYSLVYIKLMEIASEQRYAADVCAEKKQLSYSLFPTTATLDSTVGNNDYLVKNKALFRPRSQARGFPSPASTQQSWDE